MDTPSGNEMESIGCMNWERALAS